MTTKRDFRIVVFSAISANFLYFVEVWDVYGEAAVFDRYTFRLCVQPISKTWKLLYHHVSISSFLRATATYMQYKKDQA